MTAPTSPYSTAAQVAYLIQNRFYGGAPSATTVPSTTILSTLVSWSDGVIEGHYRAMGYIIPWAELPNETWPASQTTLLQFVSAMATAAMAGGHILKPAPMMGQGDRGAQGNVFTIAVDEMLKQIGQHGYGFRAQYRCGTKAEQIVALPYGPRSDFTEEYYDPTRHAWLLRKYTTELRSAFADITGMNIDWDYLYELRQESAD